MFSKTVTSLMQFSLLVEDIESSSAILKKCVNKIQRS